MAEVFRFKVARVQVTAGNQGVEVSQTLLTAPAGKYCVVKGLSGFFSTTNSGAPLFNAWFESGGRVVQVIQDKSATMGVELKGLRFDNCFIVLAPGESLTAHLEQQAASASGTWDFEASYIEREGQPA